MNPVMFFYTSTAQFEPTVCFFGVLAMYLASNGDESSRMLAAVAIGCAFLTKETGVFFLFPILIRCFLDNNNWKLAVKSSLKVIIITGIFAAMFPILAWFTCWEAFEMQFLFHFDRVRWPMFSFVFFIINNALVIAPILFCDLKAFKKDKDLSIGLIGGFGLFYIFLTRKYHTIALPLTVPLAILAGKGVQNKIRQPQYLFLGFGYTVLFASVLGYFTVNMADFCCLYNKYGYTMEECVLAYIYISLFAFSLWVIVNCIRIMLNSLKTEPDKSN
jgi:4-amino-4-deoxy-L-arabinose transferase-like glycosyltransferase